MDSRLRRLEERAGSRYPECAGGVGIVVTYPSETEAGTTVQRCPRCGRTLALIRVVYDDEEGEGATVDG